MTPEELMRLSTLAAEEANRVALAALNGQIDAAERIAARQVSAQDCSRSPSTHRQ